MTQSLVIRFAMDVGIVGDDCVGPGLLRGDNLGRFV
jgi:hypothetical protein